MTNLPTAGATSGARGEILFAITNYRPKRGFVDLLLLALIGAVLVTRNPAHLLHPQLWGEDGRVWLEQGFTRGAASLLLPQSGYLQTLSRLVALCALALPFTAIPLAFVIVALCIQLLPAALLLFRAAPLIPSPVLRLVLVAYYIGEPNSAEIYLNLTDAMWHLAFAALLILILPKPQSRAASISDRLLLVLSGFSGPFVILMLPIAWWQVLRSLKAGAVERRLCLHYAIIVSLCAAVEGFCVMTFGSQRLGHLAPSYTRFVHIIANQIILGGLIGAWSVDWLYPQPFWQGPVLPGLVCAAGFCLMAVALRYGPPAYRQFMLFCGLIMLTALRSPIITASNQWYFMQYPGIGDRYYIFPILAWFLTFVVLAQLLSRRFGSWPYLLALSPFLIGIAGDWCYPDLPDTGYQAAAMRFDAAPAGTKVTFAANPLSPVWRFTLTKR